MNWNVLKTEAEYQKAISRTLAIFHAGEGTAEADELALLLLLVKDYEDKHIHLPEIERQRIAEKKTIEEKKEKFIEFQALLLSGPVMDDRQYKDYKQLRQRLNTWRQSYV